MTRTEKVAALDTLGNAVSYLLLQEQDLDRDSADAVGMLLACYHLVAEESYHMD